MSETEKRISELEQALIAHKIGWQESTERNTELKAQVEQLQHRVKDLSAANKLSIKCLADVKANEFRKGYISALMIHTDELFPWCEKQADDYANQIRQAVKGGEE